MLVEIVYGNKLRF